MWRALFLALGINLCIMGAQCLVVDKVVLANHNNTTTETAEQPQSRFSQVGFQSGGAFSNSTDGEARIYQPKSWIPWSLLASGAIVILYTHSLPKRGSSE